MSQSDRLMNVAVGVVTLICVVGCLALADWVASRQSPSYDKYCNQVGNSLAYNQITSHYPSIREEVASGAASDHQAYDLCQQWRMAEGAEEMARIGWWQLLFSVAGLSTLVATVIYTAQAVAIANQQVNAALKSNELMNAARIDEQRPWVKFSAKVIDDLRFGADGAEVTIAFETQNVGRTPATTVWIHAGMVVPAVGVDWFNESALLRKQIEFVRIAPPFDMGHILFPGDLVVQHHTVTVSRDVLDRAMQVTEFISPRIYVVVAYGSSLDVGRHYTATVYNVRRTNRPREESVKKNRAPDAIFPDEGNIAARDLVLAQSILAPQQAS